MDLIKIRFDMKIFDKIAKKQIINYLVGKKTKIEVTPGECRWNYMCHKNVVHEAVRNDHNEISMCMYISGDYPIIHFLNVKDGEFIDNTLGEWVKEYDFYHIKFIHKADFFNVDKIFDAYRKEIRKELSWLVRMFSNIEF